ASVAPTVTIPTGPTNSAEGSPVTFGGAFTDPAGSVDAAYTYTWTATNPGGDTVASATGTLAEYPSAPPDFTFSPADNGTYHVALTVTDKDGAVGSATRTLVVTNVAPTATFTATGAPEGSPAGAAFSAPADPSPVDTTAGFRYSIALH